VCKAPGEGGGLAQYDPGIASALGRTRGGPRQNDQSDPTHRYLSPFAAWQPLDASEPPGGPVINAFLSTVVEGDGIVGWMKNSGFMMREVGVDGTLAPLDLKPAALALEARDLSRSVAFRNRIPGIFLRDCARPHLSALRYRYLTSFKATLLSEFCFTTPNAKDSDGQSGLLCPRVQTSTCSAMARASSTSMPRYLTVLSIRVWPAWRVCSVNSNLTG
jgi:hypothetical protein